MPSPLSPSKSTLVLVTGATGWVGGHVCRALLDRGYSVRAAVRDPAAEAKVKFLTDMGCELVRVPDLLGDEGWEAAMAGCDGLAHVASPVNIGGGGDADSMKAMAVEGTERALRAAAASGTVRRVVVTATMASVCGTQRESDPDHLWSEADRNDKPGSAYSASKTAAEARTWELAEEHKEKFAVTTVHPAVVIGTLLPGQPVQSTMGLLMQLCKGNRMCSMFGLCDAADVSAAHVAGLEREETAGERYLVSSTDQYSTLEFAQMASAGGAAGVDLAAWAADEDAQKMAPKKPSTNNAKVSKLLGRPLVAPEASVAAAVASLKAQGHLD